MAETISTAYTLEQLKANADTDNFVTANIIVDFNSVIDISCEGYESFLDFLSTELTGTELLMDTNYKLVGAIDGNLILQVSGDVSNILEDYEIENYGI